MFGLRHPEVADGSNTVVGDEYVGGLEIAVGDGAGEGAMEGTHTVRNVVQEFHLGLPHRSCAHSRLNVEVCLGSGEYPFVSRVAALTALSTAVSISVGFARHLIKEIRKRCRVELHHDTYAHSLPTRVDRVGIHAHSQHLHYIHIHHVLHYLHFLLYLGPVVCSHTRDPKTFHSNVSAAVFHPVRSREHLTVRTESDLPVHVQSRWVHLHHRLTASIIAHPPI
jgi:hypothetical protein